MGTCHSQIGTKNENTEPASSPWIRLSFKSCHSPVVGEKFRGMSINTGGRCAFSATLLFDCTNYSLSRNGECWVKEKRLSSQTGVWSITSLLSTVSVLLKPVSSELWRGCWLYLSLRWLSKLNEQDFPGGPVVKNLPAKAGDVSSVPGPGRFHVLWSN